MLKTGRSFGKKETIEKTLVKLRKSELRKKIKKKGGSSETIRLLKEKTRPNRDWGQQSNGWRTGLRKGDDRCWTLIQEFFFLSLRIIVFYHPINHHQRRPPCLKRGVEGPRQPISFLQTDIDRGEGSSASQLYAFHSSFAGRLGESRRWLPNKNKVGTTTTHISTYIAYVWWVGNDDVIYHNHSQKGETHDITAADKSSLPHFAMKE